MNSATQTTEAKKRAVAALAFCLSSVGRKAIRDLKKAEAAAARVAAKRTYAQEIIVSMNLTGLDGEPVTKECDLWTVNDESAVATCFAKIRQADIAHGFKCAKDGKSPRLMADLELSRLEQVIVVGMFGEQLYGDNLAEAIRLAKSVP